MRAPSRTPIPQTALRVSARKRRDEGALSDAHTTDRTLRLRAQDSQYPKPDTDTVIMMLSDIYSKGY